MRPLVLLALLAHTQAAAANTHGMTFALKSHDSTYGVDNVSCHGSSMSCDAYEGDTLCTARLPVLCIAVDGAQNPGVSTDTYNEWAYGHVGTTRPVLGTSLTSVAVGDRLCRQAFGPSWQMAEFHDGWGWGFKALGYLRDDMRFWTYIDDQPANCWD